MIMLDNEEKNVLQKGFTPHWTEAMFRINKIVLTIPITYTIIDLNGEEIEGTFYEQELQKNNAGHIPNRKVLMRQRR